MMLGVPFVGTSLSSWLFSLKRGVDLSSLKDNRNPSVVFMRGVPFAGNNMPFHHSCAIFSDTCSTFAGDPHSWYNAMACS
jgi:hypothetical protein